MRTTTGTPLDRVAERQRAVALARHFREAEGLSIAQIAQRLGRTPATVKGYFYDPSGEKARAVKARYQGVCRGCGAPTQPRNGKGDAYAYCKACHPGAIERRWTRDRVLDAMRAWQEESDFRAAIESDAEIRAALGPEGIARSFSLEQRTTSALSNRRRSSSRISLAGASEKALNSSTQ